MKMREAVLADMDSVYMMGFDIWGEGQPEGVYLAQCHASPKYRTGRWYVLEDDRGALVSSLVTYVIGSGAAGIGSIAVPPALRKRGLATGLINDMLALLTLEGVKTVFLFSDIAPEFYEKLGFHKLPAGLQRYPKSACMVWGTPVPEIINAPGFTPPAYF